MTRCRGDEELCVAASPTDRSNICQFLERRRHVSVCSLSRMSETSDASMEDLTHSDDLDISDISPWYSCNFQLLLPFFVLEQFFVLLVMYHIRYWH